MSEDPRTRRWFSTEFNDEFDVGPAEGNRAFFGLDVLRGLIEGIDDVIQVRQPRWRQYRSLGPVMLGSALSITDDDLIDKMSELAGACIVVTKHGRRERKLDRLYVANERVPGLPLRAFAELTGLAPKIEGKPQVVGPYDRIEDVELPPIRTIGFRQVTDRSVPLMHAKLALLGHLWWHDEDGSGHVADVIGFTPCRLWVSSANFTYWSRRSLEVGFWTEDKALLEGAERFLVKLMRASEGVSPEADYFDPDLAPVEYDDEAMREALADFAWDDEDEPI